MTTTTAVGGTFVAVAQHCTQDLLTITSGKSMDQGKEKGGMFVQETVWEL